MPNELYIKPLTTTLGKCNNILNDLYDLVRAFYYLFELLMIKQLLVLNFNRMLKRHSNHICPEYAL